jgi:hypothetical protein
MNRLLTFVRQQQLVLVECSICIVVVANFKVQEIVVLAEMVQKW